MKNRKVMIVDDALFMRTVLRKALSGANVQVLEAPDGPSAIRMYEEQRPDPEACVVMCSAIGQESMILEAVNSGAADFIVKPFKNEQILAAVELAFSGQSNGGKGK